MTNTGNPGFGVLANQLAAQESTLGTAAQHISDAATTLRNDGDLPVLDPGSAKLLAVLGAALGFLSANPLGFVAGAAGGAAVGKAVANAFDPYPEIRGEWLNQLPRYAQIASTAQQNLHATVAAYLSTEDAANASFRKIMPK